jgi:hypothetical protein
VTDHEERTHLAHVLDMLICIASLPELERVEHRPEVLRVVPPPMTDRRDQQTLYERARRARRKAEAA